MRRILTPAALAALCLVVAASAANAQTFTQGWASSVISSSSPVSNPGSPTNVLGDTPSTYYDLGNGGQVTVTFDHDYCNSGDAQPDICVWEWGQSDCYYICLDPADNATEAALIAAGIPQFGEFYEYAQTYCGDYCFDIDAIVPGYPAGALRFHKLMIASPSGGDPEIERISGEFLCEPVASVGDLVWLDVDCDGAKDSLEPGVEGVVVKLLDANGVFTGIQTVTDANGHYLFENLAPISWKLEFVAPAGMEWTLQDAAGSQVDSDVNADGITNTFMLWDNEATLTIDAGLCVPNCGPGAADVVVSSGDNGHKALGFPNGQKYVLGDDLIIAFTGSFTTDGTSVPDLAVVEYGTPEDYDVSVRPANAFTLAALLACGLTPDADLFFYVGEGMGVDAFDLDALCPGNAAGDLAFDLVRISNEDSDSPDIDAVLATFVCDNAPITPAIAKLGNRIWEDLDRDGIQDAGEPGVNGVVVSLCDASGAPVGLTDVTEGDGNYLFCVAPGDYTVSFAIPVGFEATVQGVGGNAVDSDIDATGKTGVVSIEAGEQDLDVDAGIVCIQATVNDALPSCSHPLEPSLTTSLPILGQTWVITFESVFPNAQLTIALSLGHPTPIPFPGTNCLIYVDTVTPGNLLAIFNGFTDANGNREIYLPLPALESLGGYPITLQAHVCEPSVEGAIPGTGDFLTNGVQVELGCP